MRAGCPVTTDHTVNAPIRSVVIRVASLTIIPKILSIILSFQISDNLHMYCSSVNGSFILLFQMYTVFPERLSCLAKRSPLG